VGALRRGFLGTDFSLTEGRVLYELAQGNASSATQLCATLGIDAGQVSRILRRLTEKGLVEKSAAADDARRALLQLTARGRRAFGKLDARSTADVAAQLASLAPESCERLQEAMRSIEQLLGGRASQTGPDVLRPPRAGELGWVVSRHGALYAEEYGWDARFEGLVAQVVADFAARFDARRDRCWIVEREQRPVGSIFAVAQSAEVCRLRLLLLEPEVRGAGLGRRLVHECIEFARQAGYRKLTLWTQSTLVAARGIYERAGFRCVAVEAHAAFGVPLEGETWELDLRPAPSLPPGKKAKPPRR
jgi:DNA-binding MarR family transcriptional regulator/GNAT superfamily N-acetyltransferase